MRGNQQIKAEPKFKLQKGKGQSVNQSHQKGGVHKNLFNFYFIFSCTILEANVGNQINQIKLRPKIKINFIAIKTTIKYNS